MSNPNQWDNFEEVLEILEKAKKGEWMWYKSKNISFKYVNVRIDMRDGKCILVDDKMKRIPIEDLKFQHEYPK